MATGMILTSKSAYSLNVLLNLSVFKVHRGIVNILYGINIIYRSLPPQYQNFRETYKIKFPCRW